MAGSAQPSAVVAVLAGGRSRRMGGEPKAVLDLGGRTLLERVADAAGGLGWPVVLVGAEAQPAAALEEVRRRLGLPWLVDRHAGAGPLSGLDAAFAVTGADRVLLLACDLPFLTLPFLRYLVEPRPAAAVVPAEDDGRCHPLCAVYGAACRAPLAERLGARQLRMHDFVRAVGALLLPRPRWQRFDAGGRLLANVNAPHDLEQARRWLAGATSEEGAASGDGGATG